jgi:hypothetical protein
MNIELIGFIILFVLFLVYIIFTEIRIIKIDKDHRKERSYLLKSVLDEADIRKQREEMDKDRNAYLKLERDKMMISGDMKELKPKEFYEDEYIEDNMVGDYEKAVQQTNEAIKKSQK